MKKVVAIFFAIVAISFCLYLGKEINSIIQPPEASQDTVLLLDSKCDLQKEDCPLRFYGEDVGMVSLSPRPFYLNEELMVSLSFDNKKARSLFIDLKGLDMDMGHNRFSLHSTDQKNYTSKLRLPTCTKDYMGWAFSIVETIDDKYFVNLFKFLGEKR